MIVVTGGAGFVGGNLLRSLNDSGESDIVVVDDLTDTRKVANLAGVRFADYLDRDELADIIASGSTALDGATAVLHQGATSSTTETDGRAVVANNHTRSKQLLAWCATRGVPLIYASSAAVYGTSASSTESPENEVPLNAYGLSKLMFDNVVRRVLPTLGSQVVGLRYFNVYGPGEEHKDAMASIVTQLDDEVAAHGTATIFGASHGHGPGMQRRDFVHVDDVVSVIRWFLDRPELSGIFNCGTGESRTFLDVAETVVMARGRGEIRFRDFPAELLDRYQHTTCSDDGRLRGAGYDRPFLPIEEGIGRYLAGRTP